MSALSHIAALALGLIFGILGAEAACAENQPVTSSQMPLARCYGYHSGNWSAIPETPRTAFHAAAKACQSLQKGYDLALVIGEESDLILTYQVIEQDTGPPIIKAAWRAPSEYVDGNQIAEPLVLTFYSAASMTALGTAAAQPGATGNVLLELETAEQCIEATAITATSEESDRSPAWCPPT